MAGRLHIVIDPFRDFAVGDFVLADQSTIDEDLATAAHIGTPHDTTMIPWDCLRAVPAPSITEGTPA